MQKGVIVLVFLLILGIALVAAGLWGMKASDTSGFSSEETFKALYVLGEQTEADWSVLVSPVLKTVPGESGTALDRLAEALLAKVSENVTPEGNPEKGLLWKSLYIAYRIGGPKVSSSVRKALLAELDSSPGKTLTAILDAALDENVQLPEAAVKAVGDLTGPERQAMLIQVFFTGFYGESKIDSDQINILKRALADNPSMKGEALRMIAGREVTRLRMYMIVHARTVLLLGILLTLDILLLALLMRADRRWTFDLKWIVILLIVDFLLVFEVLPLSYLVIKALFPEGQFSLEILHRLFHDETGLNQTAIANTAAAAFATMILGTLLAFPLAFLVGRTNLYGKKFFRSLFVMTYMVPPYVGAMAWLRLANPNVGTLNQWLRSLFALSDAPGPLNIYSLPGLIWVLSTFYYPYAFITISRAMEKMDPSLEEASRAAGASPMKTVFKVTLPMTLPSLISGALLVFVCAASCYGIPSIIGSPGRVHTVTTRIVEYVSLGQQRLDDATGMAVLLMLTSLFLLFISDLVMSRKQYITVSGKSVRPATVDLRKWRVPLTVMVSLFAVIVIGIPFATILVTSFKTDVGKNLLEAGNFTLANWNTVFGRSETLSCLKNSLIYGAVTATVGVLIACVMSYLLQRTQIRGRHLPNFLITLGSGTPSVVIALGLIMTMKGSFGINIYNTAWILIVAYLTKYMMMGMRTVVSAMSQIHVSLEECSQVSGASWLKTMLRITGPLIFPSIAAGWFLIFIPSFYELSMTTLLYSNTTKTIGFQLYEYWTFTSQPQSCAMAFGILMMVMILNAVLNRITGGKFSL